MWTLFINFTRAQQRYISCLWQKVRTKSAAGKPTTFSSWLFYVYFFQDIIYNESPKVFLNFSGFPSEGVVVNAWNISHWTALAYYRRVSCDIRCTRSIVKIVKLVQIIHCTRSIVKLVKLVQIWTNLTHCIRMIHTIWS